MLNSMTSMISYAGPRELPRNLAKNVVAALNGELVTALIFSLKTFAAALLGLFIAFWLALDEPYWVLLTVFIVAQPDSGLVLAKGFYQLLGTAAGVLMTVALVFAFAQYGELFIASLAVWIGLCSFAARVVRGFATYSFQLAGYTVAIVGVPAALNPNAAYPIICNCSPSVGYFDGARGAPARVRRIASRAPMERRRAVSMTERMSA